MVKKYAAKKDITEDLFHLTEDVVNFSENYIHSGKYSAIFLNGKWGSGKTSFIEFLKGFNKQKDWKRRAKIKNVNIWEFNVLATPYQDVYSEVFRFKFLFWRFIFTILSILIYVVISVGALVVPIMTMVMKSSNMFWEVIISAAVVLLLVGLLIMIKEHFNKINWERYYYKKLKKGANSNRKKKIVIIFDDFDRVPTDYRKTMYPILNILIEYEYIISIIIGDYEVMGKEDYTFIQKMIHTRYDVPDKLTGEQVWKNFHKDIETQIEMKKEDNIHINIDNGDWLILKELGDIFTKEKRTSRDANEFFGLLEQHYFKWKYNEINFGQFSVIAYAYLFNRQLYGWVNMRKSELVSQPYETSNGIERLKAELYEKHGLLAKLLDDYLFYLTSRAAHPGRDFRFTRRIVPLYLHPEISSPAFFQQYMPDNTDRLLKTNEIEKLFMKSKEAFFKDIQGEQGKTKLSLLKIYFNGIAKDSLEVNLLGTYLSNTAYAFVKPMRQNNNLTTATEPFYALITYFKRSNIAESKLRELLMNMDFDLSEKILLLDHISNRYDTEQEQKKEYESKIKECLDQFEESVIYEQPIMLITKALQYKNKEEYLSIMNLLLEMTNDDLFVFLTEAFKELSVPGQPTMLNIEKIYYSDEFKREIDKKITTFTDEQKRQIKEFTSNYEELESKRSTKSMN